jgi:hypothetical protein
VVVDARVIGQAGRAENFEAGLTTLGVAIAEVGIAIAASARGIIAAAIPGCVFDAGYFDDFTLHAGQTPTEVAILLAFAGLRKPVLFLLVL